MNNYHNDEVVILYGRGIATYWYINYLNSFGISINYIVDRDITKQGSKYMGADVISIEDMLSKTKGRNYKVIIAAPKYRDEIQQFLLGYVDKERIFSFEAEIYYSFLTDIKGYRKYLIDVMSEDQYFPKDIIKLNEVEAIVELGSNNGETLKDIIKMTGGRFRKIYCFEPEYKIFIRHHNWGATETVLYAVV